MKNKLIVFSAILLVSIMVAGGTFAWFTSSPEASVNKAQMGIIKVEVIKNGIGDIKIENDGTSDCYVRVRLVPQWSDPSLSISDVAISIGGDWKKENDYYYYKKVLKEVEVTKDLIKSIDFSTIEGATFTLKVVAEGVQTTYQAWEKVWSINKLPF